MLSCQIGCMRSGNAEKTRASTGVAYQRGLVDCHPLTRWRVRDPASIAIVVGISLESLVDFTGPGRPTEGKTF